MGSVNQTNPLIYEVAFPNLIFEYKPADDEIVVSANFPVLVQYLKPHIHVLEKTQYDPRYQHQLLVH